MKIKLNDVFHFRYHPTGEQGWDSRTHCFEGLLIARKDNDGNLQLVDTYWGINDTSGRVFNPSEIDKKGILTFYCNFNDIEAIDYYEKNYYDDKDIFWLHRQKACVPSCEYYYKKKGATRSKTKMLEVINEKIREAKRKANSYIEDIARYSETKAKIEKDDLSVYL